MKLAEIRAGAENEPIFWTCDEDAETLSQDLG